MALKITRIQDDGQRFVIRGSGDLYSELNDIFGHMGLGINVTEGGDGAANVLYTENNRDIVLRVLYDHTDKPPLEELGAE